MTTWCPIWDNGCDTCSGDCGELRERIDSWPLDGVIPQGSIPSQTALEEIDCRWACTVIESPSPANGYTTIVEFDDNPPGGGAWYDVRIRWLDTVSPQVGGCKPNCDDGNSCSVDGCDPVSGCHHTLLADGEVCSDHNNCTTGDACVGGGCVAGEPVDCSYSASASCDQDTGQCVDPLGAACANAGGAWDGYRCACPSGWYDGSACHHVSPYCAAPGTLDAKDQCSGSCGANAAPYDQYVGCACHDGFVFDPAAGACVAHCAGGGSSDCVAPELPDPSAIPGLVLWVEADHGVTFDGEQRVERWPIAAARATTSCARTTGSRPRSSTTRSTVARRYA